MSASSLSLFTSAVPYYARFRSTYPQAEVAALVAHVGLDSGHRVADIGCGTGQLAIPLARYAGHVVAIDPVAAMLEAGRRTAEAAGVHNISWLQGDSSQLSTIVEPGARLATFAASFHWTDRERVVSALDETLSPTGAIVVINDVMAEAEDPEWVRAIADVRAHYPGLTASTGTLNRPSRSHREVLDESAFSEVDAFLWEWSRELNLEQVVGLQLSYSFSTPALLGDRRTAFSQDVRAAVLALQPDGVVTERFRVEALVARRPRSAAESPPPSP